MVFSEEDIATARKVLDTNFHSHKTTEERFYDLCLCLLVPQERFTRCSKIVEDLKRFDFYGCDRFGPFSRVRARAIVECGGLRFGKRKVDYLLKAWDNFEVIDAIVSLALGSKDCLTDREKRDWLVENVPGMGMKVASHFLRNIGARDLAIIDLHILKYINNGESLRGKKHYLELEEKMQAEAMKLGLTNAELDVLVWQKYSKTPWSEYIY